MRRTTGYRALLAVAPLAACLFTIALCARPAHAQKTDVLLLSNGDHVTGEIKELTRGKVRLKTDPMGTVYIKWQDIVSITSDKVFEVELESGQKFFGSLQPSSEPGQDEIVTGKTLIGVRHLSVVRVTPIKDNFWSRMDGSIDLGLSFLQQNSQLDYNLGAEVKYRAENSRTSIKISSIVRLQNETETTNRQSITIGHVQSFAPRWFWAGLGAFEANAELSLDGRTSAGGGAGRWFVQTNKINLLTWGGVLYAYERFSEQEGENVLNGIVATMFDFFIDAERKSDITAAVDIIPSFTQSGRVRIESSLEGRHEFFKDFFFKLSLLNSFDSKPPTEGTTNKNDFASPRSSEGSGDRPSTSPSVVPPRP
ncbi:MAG: DUF481 domain-containing protein [Planctomycetota bacterium]|jgi:hypothetical protein